MMTTILAIDCATGPCSVAVWRAGRVAAYLENPKPSSQSAVLMPMIEQALIQTGTAYKDLSHVTATVGPGSFTGIRVGLAAARSIAFAANLKTLGFTTLEVMAYGAYSSPHRGEVGRGAKFGTVIAEHAPTLTLPLRGREILAILNAGKGEYYYQLFGNKPTGPQLGPREQALVMAKGALLAEQPPVASALAELAATRPESAQPLTPFYIRPPDAKVPVKKL